MGYDDTIKELQDYAFKLRGENIDLQHENYRLRKDWNTIHEIARQGLDAEYRAPSLGYRKGFEDALNWIATYMRSLEQGDPREGSQQTLDLPPQGRVPEQKEGIGEKPPAERVIHARDDVARNVLKLMWPRLISDPLPEELQRDLSPEWCPNCAGRGYIPMKTTIAREGSTYTDADRMHCLVCDGTGKRKEE